MKEIIGAEINQIENTVIKGILSALLSGCLISNEKEMSRKKDLQICSILSLIL